jgi:hypothetical protein
MWVEALYSEHTAHKKSGQKTLTGWMPEYTHVNTPPKQLVRNIVPIS